MKDELRLTPTDFVTVVNQTLEYAYSSVLLVGEVASFKVNQGKWIFFDVKDEETSVPCFMTKYQLRIPIEDGMKVVVCGVPKITKWGKFSFTVGAIMPMGEGSLKKAFEALKKKLASEGLFDVDKKRQIPKDLNKIGVISSTGAAGYADFIKILNARWGGIHVQVAHTQVQGLDAPDQMIRALKYFNEKADVQAIAILRGGGSADDLACFNDEVLVRTIAASKIPVITGIGHEVDESLADLAADMRASTPSNAAEMLSRDRVSVSNNLRVSMNRIKDVVLNNIGIVGENNLGKMEITKNNVLRRIEEYKNNIKQKMRVIETLNPENVLRRGYAILTGEVYSGNVVKITTFKKEIKAIIKEVCER